MTWGPRRALVIGANGLIGSRIGAQLDARGEVWRGTCRARPTRGLLPLEITDPGAVAGVFDAVRPAVVFHAANLAGGVDFCERHPDVATTFHVHATETVARHCRQTGATMVFLSTDYVFDGTRGPAREDDPTHPLNRYGALKLAAEAAIAAIVPRYVIARTTNVFGWDPVTVTPNFLMGLVRTLEAGGTANVPSYLWGQPTDAADLAAALVELALNGDTGVWHLVGETLVDRFTWARRACGVLGLDAGSLREVGTPPADMVPRPLRSWLSTEKFTRAHVTRLHPMEHGLERMRRARDAARAG